MHFVGWITFPEEQQVCSSKERLATTEGFIILCYWSVFRVYVFCVHDTRLYSAHCWLISSTVPIKIFFFLSCMFKNTSAHTHYCVVKYVWECAVRLWVTFVTWLQWGLTVGQHRTMWSLGLWSADQTTCSSCQPSDNVCQQVGSASETASVIHPRKLFRQQASTSRQHPEVHVMLQAYSSNLSWESLMYVGRNRYNVKSGSQTVLISS